MRPLGHIISKNQAESLTSSRMINFYSPDHPKYEVLLQGASEEGSLFVWKNEFVAAARRKIQDVEEI